MVNEFSVGIHKTLAVMSVFLFLVAVRQSGYRRLYASTLELAMKSLHRP
jgi:hypothetical protein